MGFFCKQASRLGGGEAVPLHVNTCHVNTQPWEGLLTAKVLSAPQITPEDVPVASDKAEEAP